jgi:hypothetical protein
MNMKRGFALSIVGCLALLIPARGCVNDLDTYKEQLKGSDPAAVLMGFFPRYPPEYYKARIKRLTGVADKGNLGIQDYDNLAAAYDRIGESGKAIVWMERKAKALSALPPDKQPDIGPIVPPGNLTNRQYMEYTTHANWGTFIIHKWLQDGRPKARVADIQASLNHLKKAVEINPDAHAGREWAQIDIISWIDRETKSPTGQYPLFARPHNEVVEGLIGLIELGNAWNSLDVFQMIALLEAKRFPLGLIAETKLEEFYGKDAKTLFQMAAVQKLEKSANPSKDSPKFDRKNTMRGIYLGMASVEEAQRARSEFVVGQIAKGHHPDTHKRFWDGAPEYNPPVLARSLKNPAKRAMHNVTTFGAVAVILGGILAVIIATIVYIVRRVRGSAR